MSHWKDFQQVSLLAGIFFLSGMVLAVGYSGGSGIGKTPYQIGTVNDWQELIDTPTDWGKGFVLIADIDFKGQTFRLWPIPMVPASGTYVYRNWTAGDLFKECGH